MRRGHSVIPRVNVLGVGIHPVDEERAVAIIEGWIERGERRWVDLCTVHTVMECRRAPRLRRIVNSSGLSAPDGMPLVWLCRVAGERGAGRVYGPDLMLSLCRRAEVSGHRHYFYGGAPEVLEALVDNLRRAFPDLRIAGWHSPPVRPPDVPEDPEVLAEIDASEADLVWVGLGTPKQDYWMGRHRGLLAHPAALIGVGAAFDFHAGMLPQAPAWMQRSGLEWLFRLAHEPRRLAFRYLVYNPAFLVLLALQRSGLRSFPMGPR
jgi:N-acetylglucosaminyldiphosphoundecaprenol N-acetyl-beta-D-mannosaminyltransferase